MGCKSSKPSAGQAVVSTDVALHLKSSSTQESCTRELADAPVASPEKLSGSPQAPVGMAPALLAETHANSQSIMESTKSPTPIATLKKARTALIDKHEVDFIVLKYECRDAGTLSHFGHGAKESTWLVQVGREGKPIEIKLHVDRTIFTSPEVGVECDGLRVFPLNGEQSKARLRHNFVHQWPFRGVAKWIGERDVVEINPAIAKDTSPACGQEAWHPAVLTKQHKDGLFEALVMADGHGGFKEVMYPAVPASNIRYRSTRKPFLVPERTLKLEVPVDDPAQATLSLDGELMTHFFARPTPKPARKTEPIVSLTVSKDRQIVSANVGPQVFAHHISGEVRQVTLSENKHQRSWTIQIGPFAEHTIDLKIRSSLVTLTIDGDTLVDACAEDIDCARDHWECKFRFVGERRIDYAVYETNKDGRTLDSKAVVSQKLKYSRECVLSLTDESTLASANLFVDGVCFQKLPWKRHAHDEGDLKTSPMALHATYDLLCPWKVNENAPCGLTAYACTLSGALAGLHNIIADADEKREFGGDNAEGQREARCGKLSLCCID